MTKFLPLAVLLAFTSLFGLWWVVVSADPENAPWYIFALFVLFIFTTSFCLLGTFLYFLRIRLYKRYSANWYVKTSFKMAFFIALFLAVAALLAVFRLVTVFNILLAILAIALFAIWSYLGKKK